MLNDGVFKDADMVIAERGVVFRRTSSETWMVSTRSKVNLESDWPKNPFLRPIIMEIPFAEKLSGYMGWLLPVRPGRAMDVQLSEAHNPALSWQPSFGKAARHLLYLFEAAVYHCKRLAYAYADVTQHFVQIADQEVSSAPVMFSNQLGPIFEFDALTSVAVRVYEAIRFPIHKMLAPPKYDVPRSFKDLLKCSWLSPELLQVLIESWNRVGESAKHYRDCIHHYIAPGANRPFVFLIAVTNTVWGMTYWIPDNPSVRNPDKFTYDRRMDALTFGWELTDEVGFLVNWLLCHLPKRQE